MTNFNIKNKKKSLIIKLIFFKYMNIKFLIKNHLKTVKNN